MPKATSLCWTRCSDGLSVSYTTPETRRSNANLTNSSHSYTITITSSSDSDHRKICSLALPTDNWTPYGTGERSMLLECYTRSRYDTPNTLPHFGSLGGGVSALLFTVPRIRTAGYQRAFTCITAVVWKIFTANVNVEHIYIHTPDEICRPHLASNTLTLTVTV